MSQLNCQNFLKTSGSRVQQNFPNGSLSYNSFLNLRCMPQSCSIGFHKQTISTKLWLILFYVLSGVAIRVTKVEKFSQKHINSSDYKVLTRAQLHTATSNSSLLSSKTYELTKNNFTQTKIKCKNTILHQICYYIAVNVITINNFKYKLHKLIV